MTYGDLLRTAANSLTEATTTAPATTADCWDAIHYVEETLYPLLRKVRATITTRGIHLSRHPQHNKDTEDDE